VDAQAEGSPEELRFDRQERLFIDFGYVDDDLTPASSEIKEILNPRISPGLFQYYHFSDFIAEAYAMIMEKPVTPPLSGFSLEGKVTEMDRQLDALTGRIKIIMPVALTSQGALPFEAESLLSDLCDNIKPTPRLPCEPANTGRPLKKSGRRWRSGTGPSPKRRSELRSC